MTQELDQTIAEYVKIRDELSGLIRAYVNDKSHPLELRWDLFEEACKARLFDYGRWIAHLPTLDKLDVSWFDDFYKERHETVEWTDVVRDIEDSDSGRTSEFKPHLDQIKEEMLATGEAGFYLDW